MKFAVRSILVLAIAVTTVMPASAQAPVLNGPCASSNSNRLTLAGVEDASLETPLLPGDVTTVVYLLDLEGEPTTLRPTVSGGIEWDDITDYDLDINGVASGSFNPETMVGSEFASIGKKAHCSTITVTVTNFAGNPLAAIDLSLSAV